MILLVFAGSKNFVIMPAKNASFTHSSVLLIHFIHSSAAEQTDNSFPINVTYRPIFSIPLQFS
jgi:hypothetical protein